MKSVLFSGTAILAFATLTAVLLDSATVLFGTSSRGVSHGISVMLLWGLMSAIGVAALIAGRWIADLRTIALGTPGLVVCVFWLYPHPGMFEKLAVSVSLSGLLAVTILARSALEPRA